MLAREHVARMGEQRPGDGWRFFRPQGAPLRRHDFDPGLAPGATFFGPLKRAEGGRVLAPEFRGSKGPCSLRYFTTPKVNVVVEWKVWPGLSSVEGKLDWLGESGKCCVSRQKPACFWYGTPWRPVKVPSRKLPE